MITKPEAKSGDTVTSEVADVTAVVAVRKFVNQNWMRRGVDRFLGLPDGEGEKMRNLIVNGETDAQYARGARRFIFGLVKVSEQRPALLIAGVLAWFYLVVLTVLRLTVLV